MLEDVLLISEGHREAAKKIAGKIDKYELNKFIIAISGESGTGKSEIAHVLARFLKDKKIYCKILHMDDYYKILPGERTEWRKKHGINSINYNEYDWDLINRSISDFIENKIAALPCIDLLTDKKDILITDFNGISVLILEGLYSIKAKADLRVFIDVTYHETKKAQILRGKEPDNTFRLKVLEKEHEVVQSLKGLADIVLSDII